MRILFQSDHVLWNKMHGISRMSLCVLENLEKLGHECVGFCRKFTGKLNGDVLLLPANGFVGMPEEQHNIVLNSGLPITSLVYDIIPYIFLENKREQYVRNTHNTMLYSDQLITISEHSKKDIIKHLDYKKPIHVIEPGVPFTPPSYVSVEPSDYFLSVGGYGEHKGHKELLKAILQTDQQLIMVGVPYCYDKETQNLAGEARGRGLLIEFSGVDDETLIDLYRHAKALLFPTKYEGYGLPIIEAMACGCPVVTTDLTAVPEAARGAAFYIDPTVEHLVIAIEKMDDEKTRTELIKRGRKRTVGIQYANEICLSTTDWKRIANSYAAVLETPLDNL